MEEKNRHITRKVVWGYLLLLLIAVCAVGYVYSIIQQLAVHLKSGRTVVVPFNAEKADVLNPQIDAFFKALGDATKKDGNFLFQGARVVLFRLSEVAGAEVVSLVRKEKEEEKKAAE